MTVQHLLGRLSQCVVCLDRCLQVGLILYRIFEALLERWVPRTLYRGDNSADSALYRESLNGGEGCIGVSEITAQQDTTGPRHGRQDIRRAFQMHGQCTVVS